MATTRIVRLPYIYTGSGGDHGALTGLGDDDHTQYHTDTRALVWLGTRSTDDLSEGSSLYWTQARFDAALTASDTGDLSEGSNLYFTDARADARIAVASVADLSDVSSVGSGAIITGAERTKLAGLEEVGDRTLSWTRVAAVREDITANEYWTPSSDITITGVRVTPRGTAAPGSVASDVTLSVTNITDTQEMLASAAEVLDGGVVGTRATVALTATTANLDVDAGDALELTLVFPSDTTPATSGGVPTGSVLVEVLYVER